MRTHTLLVVLVLLLIVAFLAINWSVFAASAKVSFVFASIEVPIGLVMLGILTLIALTFEFIVLFLGARYCSSFADKQRN